MASTSKLSKIAKNEYVYSIITKFITFAVGIIQSVVVARYLGAELKGVNTYITSITSIGAIVITLGMHQAYPYFRKKYGKDAIYQDFVSLIMLIYIIYISIGVSLAIFLPVSFKMKAVFVLIPLLGYSRVVSYIALIERPNLRNTWWMVISIADIVYVALLWLLIERSVFWAISIILFADLLKCVVYTAMLKVIPKIHKGLAKMAVELGKFGFFPMLALLMTTLNYRLDVLMLHQYDYISDSMIGVYSLGLSLSDKIVMIPDTLKGVLVSKLAKGAGSSEVAKVCRIGLFASTFLCGVIILLGKLAIKVLYGEEYNGAYSIVIITSLGVLAVSYFKLIAQYNIVNRKQILNVVMLSIAIIVDVVLNLLLIPLWGIEGAAVATSIGNLVCGVVFIVYFSSHNNIKIREMIILQKSDIKQLKSILKKK